MKKILSCSLFLAGLGFAFTSAHAAQTYNGNAASGFGGAFGNSSLSISNDPGTGLITFVLTAAAPLTNDAVFYIDPNGTGTYADTSAFADNGDGGREAISGYNSSNTPASRTLATFASGFAADYAISVDQPNSFAGLFQLEPGGNNSLNFIRSASLSNPSGNIYTFSVLASDLGLTTGQSFSFEASYISDSAYRSNETYGASTTVPDAAGGTGVNAGFNGSVTFTSADTYTLAVPEPGMLGLVLSGAGFLCLMRRRA